MRRSFRLLLAIVTTTTWAAPSAARADARVPIAVMELAARGVDEAAAGALTTEVSNTLSDLRVFRVITREDIRRLLQLEETRAQCTGEVDAACMAEIGGALGVDFLIYGEIAKIAETYSLSLVLLDIAKAEATNRANRKIDQAGALLEEVDLTTKLLVQPLLKDKKGYLVLDIREPSAKVSLDARTVGFSPLPGRLELGMGAHEVLVEKEGFLTYAKTLDVPPNQATVETISLVPSQTFIDDYESSAQTIRTAAWISAGAGAALVGAGVALKLIGDARFDDLVNKRFVTQQGSICAEINPNHSPSQFCPTSLGYENDVLNSIESIERTDTVALLALITGGASAIVASVLFLAGDEPGRYTAFGESTAGAALGLTPQGIRFVERF